MAENHSLPFADSISAARERLAQELRAQSEQIQKLNEELAELHSRHERTQSEVVRQLDAVAEAGHAAAAAGVPKAAPDLALDRVLHSVQALSNCASPEEVAQSLSEQASQWGVRTVIFDVRGKSVWGAHAHGFDSGLTEGALRSIVVPLTQDNPFRQLWDTVAEVLTNTEALKKNRSLIEKLKPAPNASILLLPIRSAGTVTGIFFADPGESAEPLPSHALKILTEFAGAQIDRLIALSGGVSEAFAPEAMEEASTEPLSEDAHAHISPAVSDPPQVQESAAIEQGSPEPVSIESGFDPPGAAEISAHAEVEQEPTETFPSDPPAEAPSEESSRESAMVSSKAEWKGAGVLNEATQEFPVPEEVLAANESASPHVEGQEAGIADTHHIPQDEVVAVLVQEVESSTPHDSSAPSPSSEAALVSDAVVTPPILDPAEMDEAQQKAHKDAKRFAKLLVSEIELYNKGKVADGRQNHDLYKRLKSDIDRSRLTFEKRFGKGPSQQMDYFYDELVKILAQNDTALMGPDYPGPSV